MTVEMGETYQFNNAKATVLLLTADQVIWRCKEAKRGTCTTPRWYFEKYAVRTAATSDPVGPLQGCGK